jgi:hypothetical protein
MRTRKKVRGKKGRLSLKKARNSLQARLDRVGAEHFGILAVDSSKARFQVLLGNFCGTVLMEPLEVDNSGPALDRLVETVRLEMERYGLKDLVAGVDTAEGPSLLHVHAVHSVHNAHTCFGDGCLYPALRGPR